MNLFKVVQSLLFLSLAVAIYAAPPRKPLKLTNLRMKLSGQEGKLSSITFDVYVKDEYFTYVCDAKDEPRTGVWHGCQSRGQFVHREREPMAFQFNPDMSLLAHMLANRPFQLLVAYGGRHEQLQYYRTNIKRSYLRTDNIDSGRSTEDDTDNDIVLALMKDIKML